MSKADAIKIGNKTIRTSNISVIDMSIMEEPKLMKTGELIINKIETDEEGKIHLYYSEEVKN